MPQSKKLGVLGGLGPMATVYFYELITLHTKASKDQDHIDMVISSCPSTPDRTAFILGQSEEDPFASMEQEAKHLVAYGADVLAIPCNTAHFFYEKLCGVLPVPVLNMVGDTVAHIRQLGGSKAGILATDGTVQSGTYQRECEKQGLAWAVPSASAQKGVMRLIYENIKSGLPPEQSLFCKAAEELYAAGCSHLVLGCTELSLLEKAGLTDSRCVDSMAVLAEQAILACGKTPVGFAG